jgi:hypothetical protein
MPAISPLQLFLLETRKFLRSTKKLETLCTRFDEDYQVSSNSAPAVFNVLGEVSCRKDSRRMRSICVQRDRERDWNAEILILLVRDLKR